MVARLLARSSWRFHRHHPLQLMLSMFGIILGVGIVTSVLITNHSAVRAFALSSNALYGKATHQIVAANGLNDNQAAAFMKAYPSNVIAPIVETELIIKGELVTLVGLDPFREAQFGRLQTNTSPRNASPDKVNSGKVNPGNTNFDISSLSSATHPLWASEATAERLELTVGETIAIDGVNVTIAGMFQTASRAASDGLLVTDISVAQILANQLGKIDRLELLINDADVRAITETLPAQWRLQATAQRQNTMQAMTKGFQINLTAMSLLALLVGMFLIHNTMTFAVLQRREVFAIKRLIGVSASGVFTIVMAEAFIFSAVASLFGLVAGILIAQKLLQLTTQTINDLYFVLHVQQIHLSPWVLLAGLVLGIGSSVLAALLAAREAAASNAVQARRRSAIEEKTGQLLPWLLSIGLALLIIGVALARIPSQSLLLGFAALMIVIVGYGLCIPWVSYALLSLVRKLLGPLNVVLALALGSLTTNMSRTGLAIAALSVAVSATLGVDIMIGSFRNSVDTWLKQTLQSDVYITRGDTNSTGRSAAGDINENWLKQLTGLEGVADISTVTVVDAVTNLDTFDMLVLSPNAASERSYQWVSKFNNNLDNTSWNSFLTTQSILITEPLANKHRLTAGDEVRLFTETKGDVVFKIAGVYRDYGSSHGRMVIHRSNYARFWNNPRVGSIGVSIKSDADVPATIARVRQQTKQLKIPARVRDNVSIHRESLAIFDRTFAVTRVLRWLTMGVAFVGIFSALLAMHLERARDFAVLRASGGSQTQLRQIIGIQSIGMGITAGLLAIPLGWFMSEMLIHIINVRSFGWSMSSILPADAIPQTLFLSIASAALAGIYPAWRLGKSSLVHELRSE